MASNPKTLTVNGVARAVNACIKGQKLATRPGFRAHPLGEDGAPLRSGNVQGAVYFNPAIGQSQQRFGTFQDGIVVSCSGKRLHLVFGNTVSVSDETNDLGGAKDTLVVDLFQAENYVIAQDGASRIWIWDGKSSAFTSSGYDVDHPEQSSLANGGSVGGYAHGRILQVIEGNRVIVGDILHRISPASPRDILRTTEQVYFATGTFFSPPSGMGPVTAIKILPLSNTMHGHDDVVIHCRRGAFSLKIDHYPRTEWVAVATSKHLLIGNAASGTYAVVGYDGDQMFRSRSGIHSIRSAAASANTVGAPIRPISAPVQHWLDADHSSMLNFCSMAKWPIAKRIFCTTGLWNYGSWRGGRGILSLHTNPDSALDPDLRCWEGMWTLPPELGLPSQLVEAPFDSGDRFFVFGAREYCNDGEPAFETVLSECHEWLDYDVLEDGTTRRIPTQVITAMAPLEDGHLEKTFNDGRITFEGVRGDLDWGVWARNDSDGEWVMWRSGKFLSASAAETGLARPKTYDISRDLGEPPLAIRKGRHIQLLIRWIGYAELDTVTVGNSADTSNAVPQPDGERLVETVQSTYNDYEYPAEGETWQQ